MKNYSKVIKKMEREQLTLKQLRLTMEDIICLRDMGYNIKDQYDPRVEDYTYYIIPSGDMAYIKIATQSFGVLCNYIYGTSFKVIFGRWKANAVAEGNSSRALSDEKCLLVWYEKQEYPKEKKRPSSKKNQRLST